MNTNPVFVVGVSRSGTSLMRSILNASSQVAIADENNYLGHIIRSEGARYKFRRLGDLDDDATVRRLADFIYSLEIREQSLFNNRAYWQWLIDHVDRETFVRRVLDTDRSERAVFAIMLRLYADAQGGKPVMGEKTPDHFRYVSTLLEWFPKARIVHMVRDPRGNYVSELKMRRHKPRKKLSTLYRQLKRSDLALRLFILALTTLAWRKSAATALQGQKSHPDQYDVLRFEDLIGDPKKQVQTLCAFLGIDFEEQMLAQQVERGYFNRGTKGFDDRSIDRWKERIDPWADGWLRTVLGGKMDRLGYTSSRE